LRKYTKLLVAVLMITLSSGSFAQRYSLVAGLNLSTIVWKYEDGTSPDDIKMKPGFLIGFTAQIPKTGMFSFETGLRLSNKGSYINTSFTDKMDLYYLEAPLFARISFEVGTVNIFTTLGPYLGIGLVSNDFPYFYLLRRYDLGLGFGAGVVIFDALQVGLSYDLGLVNLSGVPET